MEKVNMIGEETNLSLEPIGRVLQRHQRNYWIEWATQVFADPNLKTTSLWALAKHKLHEHGVDNPPPRKSGAQRRQSKQKK